jgi:Calcineurin-like phosphoesterase
MDTRPYPSEQFLARSLRSQPGKVRSFFWGLIAALIVSSIVAGILAALAFYFYVCVVAQCGKTADPTRTSEPNAKSPAIAVKPAEVNYLWVQLMPDGESGTPGGRLVRAIGPQGGSCPTIAQGGNSFQMNQRLPAVRAAFPILLCEFVLIENSEARIGAVVIPPRADEPNDIVVLGDTGCRMVYWQIQPCRDPADWPFAKVAASASRKVVTGRSFILHVGDFHYRENPCIDSSTECGTSPYGDNWATWREEFFEPAKPLLLAAPWVILRGNHEDCARAGAGWIFLFALPGQYDRGAACDSEGPMYQVNIGNTDEEPARPRILVVMDTSDERNAYQFTANCERYRKQLEKLKAEEPARSTQEVWLAMHQPLWGRNMDGEQQKAATSLDDKQIANDTPANASDKPADGQAIDCDNGNPKSALPVIREKFQMAKDKKIARLVFAGDNHAFQFFWPTEPTSPIQIIAGNGGTKLDTLYPLLPPGTKYKKKTPDEKRDPDTSPPKVNEVTSSGRKGSNLTLMQHGFTVMHRVGTRWAATQFNRDGNSTAACEFSEALSATSPDSTKCELLGKQASSG